MKGEPTYEATDYIDITGEHEASGTAFSMVSESMFFVVEPMPNNIFRFYVKEEAISRLMEIANHQGVVPQVIPCSLCGRLGKGTMVHLHKGRYIGDCCWDERLRTTQ